MITGSWTLHKNQGWVYFNSIPDDSPKHQMSILSANCDRIDLPKARIILDESIGLNLVFISVEQARQAWNELVEQGWSLYTPPPIRRSEQRRRSSRKPFKKQYCDISNSANFDAFEPMSLEQALEELKKNLQDEELSEYGANQGNQEPF
jgi:hypothetical protein